MLWNSLTLLYHIWFPYWAVHGLVVVVTVMTVTSLAPMVAVAAVVKKVVFEVVIQWIHHVYQIHVLKKSLQRSNSVIFTWKMPKISHCPARRPRCHFCPLQFFEDKIFQIFLYLLIVLNFVFVDQHDWYVDFLFYLDQDNLSLWPEGGMMPIEDSKFRRMKKRRTRQDNVTF